MSQTHSLTGRLAVSAICQWYVVRFRCSLRFCHLEFDKKAITDVFMPFSRFLGGEEGLILSDFRELSFFGPCLLFKPK